MAIRINFINDFTYLLHFYFSENAKVKNNGTAQKISLSTIFSLLITYNYGLLMLNDWSTSH